MKPLAFEVAHNVVATFSALHCVHKTAEKMKLSRQQISPLLDFVWNRTVTAENIKGCVRFPQLRLYEFLYCEFLYTANVSAEDAAKALGWRLERVQSSCGGPAEWRKTAERKSLRNGTTSRERGSRDDDPTEEEIYAAAAELRKSWTPTDPRWQERNKRVEALRYVLDGDDPQLFRGM